MKKTKTTVYIDGQNFLYKVADILIARHIISNKQEISAIDIRGILNKILKNNEFEIKYFGVSKIRQSKDLDEETIIKSRCFSDNLRRIRNFLIKQDIQFVASGTLIPRISEPCKKCGYSRFYYVEKGVDVSLAVDLINDAATNKVDNIVLISSDMDLIPAIVSARELYKKKVLYVGFENKLTKAIKSRVDSYHCIKEIDVVTAFLRIDKKY